MLSNARVIVKDSNDETVCDIVVRNKSDFAMIRMLISQYYLHKYQEAIASFEAESLFSEADVQEEMFNVFDRFAKELYDKLAFLDVLEKGDETHG